MTIKCAVEFCVIRTGDTLNILNFEERGSGVRWRWVASALVQTAGALVIKKIRPDLRNIKGIPKRLCMYLSLNVPFVSCKPDCI